MARSTGPPMMVEEHVSGHVCLSDAGCGLSDAGCVRHFESLEGAIGRMLEGGDSACRC